MATDTRWRRVLDSLPITTRKFQVWNPRTEHDFAFFDGYKWTEHRTGQELEPTHWKPLDRP